MNLLGQKRLAAFGANHDRIEVLAAFAVLMQQRSPAYVDHMSVAPVHDRHHDRIEIEPLRACAAEAAMRPSPAPSSACGRSRKPRRANWARRTSTWRIDSGVDTEWVWQRRIETLGPNALDNPDLLMPPSSVAESYWMLYQQPKSAWTFELEVRPFCEKW